MVELENTISRSASATSSLDPYYFGLRSPSDSPPPPLPVAVHKSATPETHLIHDPVTPAKDPSTIDRRGLVGVGELSTPRWTRLERASTESHDDDGDDFEVVHPENTEKDGPDSPWTIEAIDGESGEDEVCSLRSSDDVTYRSSFYALLKPTEFHSIPRPLRSRPSMTEESGGEEILYPRKSHADPSKSPEPTQGHNAPFLSAADILSVESPTPKSPPTSFGTPFRKAKKRTSDEFEMDHSGMPVSKHHGSLSGFAKDKSREEKSGVRKHRSLNSGTFPGASREKGRRESVGLTLISGVRTSHGAGKLSDRHTRQTSESSSSSNHGDGRRVHTSDFSHLPPSPSSSSIQHFLRHTSTTSSTTAPLLQLSSKEHQPLSSPNVAHSLLRGTQEGWSCLDDEATAEALRKLDGLTGKTARARASVGSFGRPASLSRPGTPPGKSGSQWEGVGPAEGTKVSRRASLHQKDTKETEDKDQVRHVKGHAGDIVPNDGELAGSAIGSSDEQRTPSIMEKTPKKASNSSTRSSFTPKRGSASSTTYTSTPTTTASSRDSTSLSATTSLTSVSASGRHSIGKARRNSAGSDVSSIHSSDATSLKDRVASLALAGETLEDETVPPVPPLPKDLSTYRSPPASSASYAFPALSTSEKRGSHESNEDPAAPLEGSIEIHSDANSPLTSRPTANFTGSQLESAPTVHKTPSKKWSFSALNLKLSGSPSSSAKSSAFPLSPRTVSFGPRLRKSASKDQALSPSSGVSKNSWSSVQQDAMSSAASLVSFSSSGSAPVSKSPTLASSFANLKAPEGIVRSRSGTDSSASTNHTTSALAPPLAPISPTSSVRRGHSSKRLTPSSIPFFRRSSSHSIQIPPSSVIATSSSPTPVGVAQSRSKGEISLPKDLLHPSSSAPGSAWKKSSVLSLGLPSLLKGSSSRRSLHDASKDVKDHQKAEGGETEGETFEKEKEKSKKDDKDRSESRISVLMGRKRGKVCHFQTYLDSIYLINPAFEDTFVN